MTHGTDNMGGLLLDDIGLEAHHGAVSPAQDPSDMDEALASLDGAFATL